MIRLLMLDLDPLLVAVIARALRHDGVAVEGVRSASTARAMVASGTVDAALLDANLIETADFAALGHVPVILTSSFGADAGCFRGARVLRKPFTSGELLAALREALGPLETEPQRLVDILLRDHTLRRTTALCVGDAELFMEDGELVHVRLGCAEGEAALAALLADSPRPPQRMPARVVTRTIVRPFHTVLFDALSVVEARERSGPRRAPSSSSPFRRGGPHS